LEWATELEGLEWATEVVVKYMSWVAMVVVDPLEARFLWRAGVWDSATGRAKAPLPSQILGAALGQEHLTQTVV
jgi:hypothetical protein